MATIINGDGIVSVEGTSSSQGRVRLYEDTDNGTNYIELTAPASVAANVTLSTPTNQTSATVGYLNIPQSGAAKTGSYQLTTADVGQFIQVSTGGSITIPDATFSAGDVVSVFNNTTGNITITCSITTAYKGGTDADQATVTLQTRGVATILFISGTVCVINGNLA